MSVFLFHKRLLVLWPLLCCRITVFINWKWVTRWLGDSGRERASLFPESYPVKLKAFVEHCWGLWNARESYPGTDATNYELLLTTGWRAVEFIIRHGETVSRRHICGRSFGFLRSSRERTKDKCKTYRELAIDILNTWFKVIQNDVDYQTTASLWKLYQNK